MNLIALSAKLPREQMRALKSLSERTRIPQSELLREGIDLVLERHKEDVVTPELRRQIDKLLSEDAHLLKRLAKA